jgi:hypothetical protein
LPCVSDSVHAKLGELAEPRRLPSESEGLVALDEVAQRPKVSSEAVEGKRFVSRRDEQVVQGKEDQVGGRVSLLEKR